MSETLEQRLFRYADALNNKLSPISVHFIKYDPNDTENTDFSVMIKTHAKSVFLYNDATDGVREYRSDNCLIGLKKHPECAGYALAIPTGEDDSTLYAILKVGCRIADCPVGEITDVYVSSDKEQSTLEPERQELMTALFERMFGARHQTSVA